MMATELLEDIGANLVCVSFQTVYFGRHSPVYLSAG